MRFLDQTTFGHPGGDCFSACLGSLLGLSSADEVPYFMGDQNEDWLLACNVWLSSMGHPFRVLPISLDPDDEGRTEFSALCRGSMLGATVIAGGLSPRGQGPSDLHSVLWTGGRSGEVVFDPHPSRDGLLGEPRFFFLLVYVGPKEAL